jgi:hypothetical protein
LGGRPRRLPVDVFRPAGFLAFALAPPEPLATLPRRRPGRGLRAPATSSLTCVEHMSFTKFPRDALIVTVSAAGLPHTSHTRIVFSAM